MRPSRMVPFTVLAALSAAGCSFDLAGPEEKPPDVRGLWMVSVSEVSPHLIQADSASAVCIVDDFEVSLTKKKKTGREEFAYSGSHSGFEMVCSGITESATTVLGIPDTVVVVAPGTLTGKVGRGHCQFLQGCAWDLGMSGDGFSLSASSAHSHGLSNVGLGGTFMWRPSESVWAFGDFSAHR